MTKSLDALLREWYAQNQRVLPWRSDPSPYHVFLSESMLQQTRVAQARGHYLRFIEALPSFEALAEASEEEVLKLWEGLGYYSRARNLRKAAIKVIEDFGGELPRDKESLLALPGVGRYTAAAISSLAFHQKEVAIDGNLVRVYARLKALPLDPKSEKDKRQAEQGLLAEMGEDPSSFNQALMDIGELFCLPHGTPLCATCPLKGICLAHGKNEETKYPLQTKKATRRIEDWTFFLLRHDEALLLEKRPDHGLLASLYGLPGVLGHLNEKEARYYIENEFGYAVETIENLGEARHVFSHVEWHMKAFQITVKAKKDGLWASQEDIENRYSIPTAFSYFL